jgi:hypothetical protein
VVAWELSGGRSAILFRRLRHQQVHPGSAPVEYEGVARGIVDGSGHITLRDASLRAQARSLESGGPRRRQPARTANEREGQTLADAWIDPNDPVLAGVG